VSFPKNKQYYKFCFYGFLKNLRFFDAFFLLYLKSKGISYTEIGSLYAIREILTYFMEVPTGIIADLYGRKNALAGSFLAYILSFYLFYIGNSYGIFLLAFILYGIGDAFRSGTHKAMIMDYLKRNNLFDQKINYYGHTRACSQRGSAISSLLAGLIVFYSGNYEQIFLLSIVPYILDFFLILSYPAYLNKVADKKERNFFMAFKNLWSVIKNPKVFGIMHSSAVHTAFMKSVKDYIQFLMKMLALSLPFLLWMNEQKREALWIGFLYFVIYLMTSFASSKAGFLAKKYANIAMVSLFIGFLFGILSGVLQLNKFYIWAFVFFVGIYIIENIRKPILTGYLAEAVPQQYMASVLSAQNLYKTLLTAIFSLIFGGLADYKDVGFALLVLSLILLFINVFIIFRLNLLNKLRK